MPTNSLVVHGGCGKIPLEIRADHQAAVDRALELGWAAIGRGALEAVVAAVREMEDDPILNAGIGATLNSDGVAELDAGIMEGAGLRAGGVAGVQNIRHPIDAARAVMEDGRHVLLMAEGASALARAKGLEMCENSIFITDHRRAQRAIPGDTVGAVARDAEGRVAVAVSTGGSKDKLAGRVGDSPIPGAGFYADDRLGAACGTGLGEAFLRTVLCKQAVELMATRDPQAAAAEAIAIMAGRVQGWGGLIMVSAAGLIGAAHNAEHMGWAQRSDG